MTHSDDSDSQEIDYTTIGFYGRPISELSREELLAAFAELVDVYNKCVHKNNRCKEVLGEKTFDTL